MDLAYIESLAELLAASTASEVTVRRGGRAVTVRRHPGGRVAVVAALAEEASATPLLAQPALARPDGEALPLVASAETALVPLAVAPEAEVHCELVRARRVGVFHRGLTEGGAPLVQVGDQVVPRQQVGCIESMTVYDEVDCPVAGRVVGIFVADGEAVEYGQELLHIEVGSEPAAAGGEQRP
ncbi:MAG: hypothetical protein IT204_21925 [Fimbriimonadaceae bacterium]|nr:hypothetical protein [Fimbriimonadaceae bacterium]